MRRITAAQLGDVCRGGDPGLRRSAGEHGRRRWCMCGSRRAGLLATERVAAGGGAPPGRYRSPTAWCAGDAVFPAGQVQAEVLLITSATPCRRASYRSPAWPREYGHDLVAVPPVALRRWQGSGRTSPSWADPRSSPKFGDRGPITPLFHRLSYDFRPSGWRGSRFTSGPPCGRPAAHHRRGTVSRSRPRPRRPVSDWAGGADQVVQVARRGLGAAVIRPTAAPVADSSARPTWPRSRPQRRPATCARLPIHFTPLSRMGLCDA